jgi:hypothetical protein
MGKDTPRILEILGIISRHEDLYKSKLQLGDCIPVEAYTADNVARLVYQEKSTDLSPARNHISSANLANSAIDEATFSGSDITASAFH